MDYTEWKKRWQSLISPYIENPRLELSLLKENIPERGERGLFDVHTLPEAWKILVCQKLRNKLKNLSLVNNEPNECIIELYKEVNYLVKRIEELEGNALLKLDTDYLNSIYFNLPKTYQKYWDYYKFEGDEWTAFLTFLEAEYKIALKKQPFMEVLEIEKEFERKEIEVNRSSIHLSKSEDAEEISKEREKLWTSRQCVYTCIENNMNVSKPFNTFRSKVKKFLGKYRNQITEN